MARQQQRKREQLRRRYAPGQNWFISEDSAQRRRIGGRQMTNKTSSEEKKEENTDLENKQDHLQSLSWPVSPNGDGLLINVKPLYPCAEPEEVLGAFTPSTADSTKDPTPENNVEEQEINDPEEPSPQPQAFKPERNKKQKAYVLDFNGRVKKGAVKNFQLTSPANPDEKVIQFGRVDEDHFLQDCSFHLCTLQAFAITSSDLNTVYTCTVHTSLSP
ncbi:hypothetical protein SRHO_G00312670 [Serrasalmus rhombeus]